MNTCWLSHFFRDHKTSPFRGFVIVGKAALGPGCSDNWWDNTWYLGAVLTASQCPSWGGKLGLGHPMAMFKAAIVYQNAMDNSFSSTSFDSQLRLLQCLTDLKRGDPCTSHRTLVEPARLTDLLESKLIPKD